MQRIAISIDAETLRRVDELRSPGRDRKRRPTSRSELISQALKFYAAEQDRKAWEAKDAALYEKHGNWINAQVRDSLREQAGVR